MKYGFTICFFLFTMIHTAMAQGKGKYARVNGLDMYYEQYGSGSPLVLIHGGGSTIGTTFGRVLDAFAKNHQIIAVELQAHGHTADRNLPSSFEQDADDVAALLQELHIPKADFFGFSNGGTTTLQIAIRHPQLVRKIVVASAIYKRSGAYDWLWEGMKNPTFDQMPEPYKKAYLEINPSQEGLLAMFDRDAKRMQTFKDISEADIRGIQAPALILTADADVSRPEHAVEMFRQMQHARLMILPGGHGEYIGELTTLKPGQPETYPAVPLIEAFLAEPVK